MASGSPAEAIIDKLDTGRCVVIEITNHCKLTLRSPGYYCKSGYLHCPPMPAIMPGAQACIVFMKTSYSARGSVGVLTYKLLDEERDTLAIMFSNPFDYTLYEHSFALHFTQSSRDREDLYNGMYHSAGSMEHCRRAQGTAIQISQTLTYGGVRVSATMSRGCKCILRVLIEDVK